MPSVDEAIQVLVALGLPSAQQNERSGLTLLALLNLGPQKSWDQADAPLIGITPMMDFMAAEHGKQYAPNTRETVRRQSVHQFLAAGFIVQNPDDPQRAINSAKTTYQVTPEALELLRTYGTQDWKLALERYRLTVDALAERWERARKLERIPVTYPDGTEMTLSPGGQNVLIAALVEDFCPAFTPGARVLYVGDADEKFSVFDSAMLEELGVKIDEHGKMPDLIVYDVERDWLVLIEAVTSHGPVGPKRRDELRTFFAGAKPGLVFVTAFLDRKTLAKFINDISWETEVWVAESPTHLIHFNGERFLGPHEY